MLVQLHSLLQRQFTPEGQCSTGMPKAVAERNNSCIFTAFTRGTHSSPHPQKKTFPRMGSPHTFC